MFAVVFALNMVPFVTNLVSPHIMCLSNLELHVLSSLSQVQSIIEPIIFTTDPLLGYICSQELIWSDALVSGKPLIVKGKNQHTNCTYRCEYW